MKKTIIALSIALILTSACSTDGGSKSGMASMLPTLENWTPSQKVYTEENLYDYINGNSELYFPYGFVSLLSVHYQNNANTEQTVVVDIYDMATPLGAFGVYSNMTSPDYSYTQIGCEAIVSEQQIRFYQDRYQVEINCPNPFDGADAMMEKAAKMLSANMPVCTPPSQLSWLPTENQTPHTLKYVADGFLGQSYLAGGVEAVFELGGNEVRGFAMKCASAAEAKANLAKYRDASKVFEGTELKDTGDSFTSYHKYAGHTTASIQNEWFFGAISQDSGELSATIASQIKANLPE